MVLYVKQDANKICKLKVTVLADKRKLFRYLKVLTTNICFKLIELSISLSLSYLGNAT